MTGKSISLSRSQKPILFAGILIFAAGIAMLLLAAWIESGDFGRIRRLQGLVISDIAPVIVALGIVVGVSSFFYNLDPVRWTYSKLVAPAVLVFTSTLVALALVEIVLHLKYRDIQIGGGNSPSAYTFYRKYYKTNSWGFRDVEREVDKQPGTFRILVLGDSFTFGAGVKYKESLYTALLEKKLDGLAGDSARFEVINSGLKGLNTAEELLYLRNTGLALNPDLVIVGHVLNDAETPEFRRERDKESAESTLLPTNYHTLLNYFSFTYYLTRQNFIGLMQTAAAKEDSKVGYHAYLDKLYSGANLEEYENIMVELTRTCEDRGIPVVWVSFPELRGVRADPYPFSHVSDILRGIADRNQMRIIELHGAIAASNAKELTVSPWDGHPNEAVQRIAADEIFNRLISDRLIPMHSGNAVQEDLE